MRHLLGAFALLLAFPAFALADGPTLVEARQRLLHGNYDEAAELYTTLAKQARSRVPATVGLSRALERQGEYDRALEVVDATLKDRPKDADLSARRAEVLYLRGRWEDAEKAADLALQTKPDHFLARWIRGQVYNDRGDVKKADAEFRWFVRTYTERSNNDMDVKAPEELVLIGQAGCENARWHDLSDQFQFILQEVYGDALKADKDYWPAHYQAGALLLEKYNRPEAADEFDKALATNPQAAECLVGKGVIALQKFEIQDAEQLAERALKVNVHLPDALRLRADVHLASGNVAGALKELEQARAVNPRDERTLARIAACLVLQHRDADLAALVKDVEAHDPKPGLFYYELGERLEDRRRFDEAEKDYKKAAELRPLLPWPRSSLGLLEMRLGREKEARTLLDQAFAADPFNVRVSNSLKVLRHLEKYDTLTTEHFRLRYDPSTDKLQARYMADYLEHVYADLAEKFHHKPQGTILVEVFNSHEMFSGRVVALPDLHTIGACTGRMIGMASPHGKGIAKPFNWGRVLRHELVHVFNLDQTHFQVTHWFTEGLAVSNEGYPRPQQWNQLLLERVPRGELMNLGDIDLGFIRPRSPLDWHMAYCQSQLYIDYMKAKYGPQVIGAMLDAYGEGLDSAGAIDKVCHVDRETFEKGYREYLADVVKSIRGRAPEKALGYKELKEAHEKDPGNADLTARLAEQLVRRDKAQAFKLADEVLARKKDHPLANYVKARLVLQSGDVEQAKALLEAGLDRAAPEPKVVRELGKLYYDAGDFTKAAELFELGRKAEPLSNEWLQELARTYAQAGNRTKQIEVLEELVPTDADDLADRKRLARLLAEAGRNAEAERYAREALEIDVRDTDMQGTLLQALAAQKKDADAERLRKVFGG